MTDPLKPEKVTKKMKDHQESYWELIQKFELAKKTQEDLKTTLVKKQERYIKRE